VKLVDTNRRRGSRLTREGEDLLRKYSRLKRRCLEADDEIFRSIFG